MKIIVILALLLSAGCVNVETEKDTKGLDARLGDIERRLERIEKDIGLIEGM